MLREDVHTRYLVRLLEGDRSRSRAVIEEALQSGVPANSVYADIIWPIIVEIERLLRIDKITSVQEHLATRVNRCIIDQLQNKLPRRPSKGKKVAVCCAPAELQELGAQIMADIFESDGWDVKFLGGGLANDDLLAFIHEYAPDILLIYGSTPKQAPDVRQLIDTIRDVNAWPHMRIMLSGGVFGRAEGLWEEIGADLYAETPIRAIQAAASEPPVQAHQRTLNRRRKARRQTSNRAPVTAL